MKIPSIHFALGRCRWILGHGAGKVLSALCLCAIVMCPMVAVTSLKAQSPYEVSWGKDAWIMGGSVVVSFIGAALDDSLSVITDQEYMALRKEDINIIDRWATNFSSKPVSRVSDVGVGLCLASPLGLLIFDESMRKDFGKISTMYLETALLATFLPSYGKGLVTRIRPYAYNSSTERSVVESGETKRSFFSGHTTLAFASMTFFATVYSDYYPNSRYTSTVWIASMGAASGVGLLRIFSGAHFPTDVMLGALVGGAIGYGIPYLHRTSPVSVGFMPTFDGGAQLSLSMPLR
ncbi:MAG: phosphatase PAP2 family protein [Candidatus Kapaibacterium sp.]